MTPEFTSLVEYLEKKRWAIDLKIDSAVFRKNLQSLDLQGLLQLTEMAKARKGDAAVPVIYQIWLELNAGRNPHLFVVWFNLGTELSARGDNANAMTCYQNALAIKPDFHQAAINLGLMREAQGQEEAALAIWGQVLQPDDARTQLLNHRGRLMENMHRYAEAEAELYKSLLTNPHQADAIQHWTHLRQKQSAWPPFGIGVPGASREELETCAGPLSGLALIDDVAKQSRIVDEFLIRKMPPVNQTLCPPQGYKHDKIRIGYLSSDYCRHPISFLMAELFELHDRSAFEVYGYCSSIDDNSDTRKRVLASFDHLSLVQTLTDEQLAHLIREHEIDILIELNGMTKGTRIHSLRYRPAPVQLTYLGYIGPLPMPELDYIICDEFTIPHDRAPEYQPTPLYMPDCYQVNDRKLKIGAKRSRTDWGLPEDKFVLCCFSNTFKVTEEIFEAWMEILHRTENTVFWLLDDNPYSHANQEARARAHGVATDRLILAGRVSPEDYLARFAAADLFMDTYPYNSGTTASDALRMGLPLLTLAGSTFASRMAGSLAHTVGLGDMVTGSISEYIDRAVELINNPDQLKAHRQRLEGGAWARTLGDTPKFTKQLEDAYRSILKTPA